MKICHYTLSDSHIKENRVGILYGDKIIDPNLTQALLLEQKGFYNVRERADHLFNSSLSSILKNHINPLKSFQNIFSSFQQLEKSGDLSLIDKTPIFLGFDEKIKLNSPLDKITTYRDFYAHQKHVEAGFKKRNEKIPKEWFEIPAYYKGSTAGFLGNNDEILWPSYSDKLDFELELGLVIGKDGKNITRKNAIDHIFGFTILNDISARDIQKKEMAIRLGPAKGKDFCSILGPVITTIDDFSNKEPNLKMEAHINGDKWSEGYSADAHFSWAEMIEHVSKDEWMLAGDLFGSGTVGTGCGLELDKWIKPGDEISLTVEGIGTLKNIVGSKQG